MAKDTAPTDADVIFNRANVALARSQRLIQSWLPPKTAQEAAHSKTDQELLEEDEQLFKPTPELLGLGASAPDQDQDLLSRKRTTASNHRLLEQLLGKKAANGHRPMSKPQPAQKTPPTQNTTDQTNVNDEDDDEEGRATMVASNSALKRKTAVSAKTRKAPATSHADPSSDDEEDSRPTKKRAGTYLDQLLAEKASKKKRKQKG